MLKRGKTCTQWEWHGGISLGGQGDLPSLVGEDWCDKFHLIHVSVWLSVSGPSGEMYKWALYYQGRIWRLIKWCDRGLKWITLLPSLKPLSGPPAQSLYFSLPIFISDENKCKNCLSDLPSWGSWGCSPSPTLFLGRSSVADTEPYSDLTLWDIIPVETTCWCCFLQISDHSQFQPSTFSHWELKSLPVGQQGDTRLKQVPRSQEQLCQWDLRLVPVGELSILLEDTKETEGL